MALVDMSFSMLFITIRFNQTQDLLEVDSSAILVLTILYLYLKDYVILLEVMPCPFPPVSEGELEENEVHSVHSHFL